MKISVPTDMAYGIIKKNACAKIKIYAIPKTSGARNKIISATTNGKLIKIIKTSIDKNPYGVEVTFFRKQHKPTPKHMIKDIPQIVHAII